MAPNQPGECSKAANATEPYLKTVARDQKDVTHFIRLTHMSISHEGARRKYLLELSTCPSLLASPAVLKSVRTYKYIAKSATVISTNLLLIVIFPHSHGLF